MIDGRHAEAGQPFETSENTARSLVAQGFVTFGKKETHEVVAAPKIEKAVRVTKEKAIKR